MTSDDTSGRSDERHRDGEQDGPQTAGPLSAPRPDVDTGTELAHPSVPPGEKGVRTEPSGSAEH